MGENELCQRIADLTAERDKYKAALETACKRVDELQLLRRDCTKCSGTALDSDAPDYAQLDSPY